jgi:hypothetical protein
MSYAAVRKVLWWICLVAAPLVLVTIELFHPASFTKQPGMYQYLCKPEPYDPQFKALDYFGPSWWFALHMIQTPLVALVAIGLWLLVDTIDDHAVPMTLALAWISRAATFVFLIYYTALDSIGGIGLGRTILNVQGLVSERRLTPEQLDGIVLALNTTWRDPWVGGVGSMISETGSWAVFTAALSAAVALLLTKKIPWPPLLLLAGFGWELQLSHANPHGPIAFSLLIVSALWIWWVDARRSRSTDPQDRSSPPPAPPISTPALSPTTAPTQIPSPLPRAAPARTPEDAATPIDLDVTRPELADVKRAASQRIDLLPDVSQADKDALYGALTGARGIGQLLTVPFQTNVATLTPEDIPDLRSQVDHHEVKKILSNPTVVLLVLGYADAQGDQRTNIERAEPSTREKFFEFFTAPIRNANTRAAYDRRERV